MPTRPNRLSRCIVPLVALLPVCILFFLSRQPALSVREAEVLASRFQFTKLPLPQLSGYRYKTTPAEMVREVHPALRRISAFVSFTGAAVAASPTWTATANPTTSFTLTRRGPGDRRDCPGNRHTLRAVFPESLAAPLERSPPWPRLAALLAISTRTAGPTSWSTPGDARRSSSCNKPFLPPRQRLWVRTVSCRASWSSHTRCGTPAQSHRPTSMATVTST